MSLYLNLEELTGISTDIWLAGLAILVVILIIILIIQSVRLSKMKKAYTVFMQGNSGASLEDTLIKRLDELDKLAQSGEDTREELDLTLSRLNKTYQKTGLIKYNAYNEMGGRLSFALCMLNRDNDGFILNSMHSREGCYTYIKDIKKGKSDLELSGEEQESLDIAINQS